MALQIRRCLACGAPLQGYVCSYCKTVHDDPDAKPEEGVTMYADNTVFMHIPAEEIRKHLGLPKSVSEDSDSEIR